MIFKDNKKNKSEYNTDKVRVRNSYYTFSKEYPSKNILHRRKAVRTRIRKKRIAKAFLCLFAFVFISLSSYFVCDLFLKFSYKPYDTAVTKEENVNEAVLLSEEIRAWSFPMSKLSDKGYIESFAKSVKSKKGNAVVIEFKNAEGKLCYSSKNENAILSGAALYDNETLRHAISTFKEEELRIIAKIHCFRDNTVTAQNGDLAIKYLDSDVTWLDKEGNAWLNPFSKQARGYIFSLMEEILAFSVDGFVLEDVSFPYDGATDTLGFPERKDSESKNDVLLKFISSVKNRVGKNKAVMLSLTATDTINGNELKYDGSVSKNSADKTAVKVSESPEGYIIDKKSKFTSLLSLLSKLSSCLDEGKGVVVVIDKDDYSSSLRRTLLKNGYSSYIVL